MADFSNVRNSLGNVSRNVWLALGLVVIAALLAAAFLYGETDDLANQNGREDVAGEQVLDGGDDEEAAAGEVGEEDNDAAENSDDDGEEVVSTGGDEAAGSEELPRELADTGPAVPALAIGALSLTGYLYRRSASGLIDLRNE